MLSEHEQPGGMGKRWPQPGELWSLWDMVKLLDVSSIADAGDQARLVTLILNEEGPVDLHPTDRQRVAESLYKIAACCQSMDEPALAEMFTDEMSETPKRDPRTNGRWEVLEAAFWSMLLGKRAHFVERAHQRFLDNDGQLVDAAVRKSFPGATSELVQAGKAFSFGLHDSTVFHCMRAVEIGARSLAVELKCEFQHPLDQTDLHPLLEACEGKINKMKQLPKSQDKAEDLEFYSMGASNFRYFKDGWRIRAIHGRASFQQMEAERILTRSLEFFEVISKRLKE